MNKKAELRRLEKKLEKLQQRYPDIPLRDYDLKKTINEYLEADLKAFHLRFEIEHCQTCGKKLKP